MKTKRDVIMLIAAFAGIISIFPLMASAVSDYSQILRIIGCSLMVFCVGTFLLFFGNERFLSGHNSFTGWTISFCLVVGFGFLLVVDGQQLANDLLGKTHLLSRYAPQILASIAVTNFLIGYSAWWLKHGRKYGHKFGRFLLIG
jgi:xanthine/uracil permease